MLRYDDVTAENRKTHESNVSLQSQLEAQQQHSKRLEEQIKGYQQAEVTLKAWSDQLERDLKELRDAPSVDTSGLEQEALDLRQQLQKAEEDLRAADIKTEKTEREKEKYKVIIMKLTSIAVVLTISRAIMKTSRRSCTNTSRRQ